MKLPRFKRVAGSGTAERMTGPFARVWHDWDSFTPGCNWRDFAILHLGGEWNHMTQRAELEVAVLGIWLQLTYVWSDEWLCEVRQRREDIRSGRTAPRDLFDELAAQPDEPELS